jgi:hypothetical protein
MCEQGLEKEPEEITKKILLFQKYLSGKQDTKCYTVEEVEKWGSTTSMLVLNRMLD